MASYLSRELKQRIEECVRKTAMDLIDGHTPDEMLQFQKGFVNGLRWVLQRIENIESEKQ